MKSPRTTSYRASESRRATSITCSTSLWLRSWCKIQREPKFANKELAASRLGKWIYRRQSCWVLNQVRIWEAYPGIKLAGLQDSFGQENTNKKKYKADSSPSTYSRTFLLTKRSGSRLREWQFWSKNVNEVVEQAITKEKVEILKLASWPITSSILRKNEDLRITINTQLIF